MATFVTRPGHALAVSGQSWGPHVIVTAQIGASSAGVSLTTSTRGTFVIGLDYTVACGGVVVDVRDLQGHTATLRRTGPMCPNRVGDPPPKISVLQGTRSATHVRLLGYSSGPKTITLHLGDTLQLIEPGDSTPSFLASADTRHFALLEQQALSSAPCVEMTCAPLGDQFWTWVAIKRGHGTIILAPICRQSRPACEMPDRVIAIVVKP